MESAWIGLFGVLLGVLITGAVNVLLEGRRWKLERRRYLLDEKLAVYREFLQVLSLLTTKSVRSYERSRIRRLTQPDPMTPFYEEITRVRSDLDYLFLSKQLRPKLIILDQQLEILLARRGELEETVRKRSRSNPNRVLEVASDVFSEAFRETVQQAMRELADGMRHEIGIDLSQQDIVP
jgi:hypothetical protein